MTTICHLSCITFKTGATVSNAVIHSLLPVILSASLSKCTIWRNGKRRPKKFEAWHICHCWSLLTSALGSAWTMQEISTSTPTSAWIQALSTWISGSSIIENTTCLYHVQIQNTLFLQMILRSILARTGLSTPLAASQMYVPLSCRLTFGSDSRLPELCFSPEGSIWYCKTNEKHTINSDFMILS